VVTDGKGDQHVNIISHVRRADGVEVGTVGQENDVPKGLLDGPWGDLAYNVAIGAADGHRAAGLARRPRTPGTS
jgi:hypothetical protein